MLSSDILTQFRDRGVEIRGRALFAEAAETDEDRSIFLKVLDKFFDGKKDTRTLTILKEIGE